MRNLKKVNIAALLCILLIGTLILAGCSQPTTPPPVPTEPPVMTQTETPLPTTPTDRLVLVDPTGTVTQDIRNYLSSFASENGMVLETSDQVELSAQTAETKIVVELAAQANIKDIAAASPDTQFIVIGPVDPAGQANLSVIRSKPEDLAFMAGYLTMLIAWDWRAAGLLPTDIEAAADKANAFDNGAQYVCGQCTPYYAPIVYFPLLAQESSQASLDAWAAQIGTLGQNFVNSFYVDPAIAKPEVLDSLSNLAMAINNDVKLIGLEGTAQPERFTALLGADLLPALKQVLPQALQGKGGSVITTTVSIVANTNTTFVTPGKVDKFNHVAADLAAGIIVPLSIP